MVAIYSAVCVLFRPRAHVFMDVTEVSAKRPIVLRDRTKKEKEKKKKKEEKKKKSR